jgi:enediyne biosynthesis protein E4
MKRFLVVALVVVCVASLAGLAFVAYGVLQSPGVTTPTTAGGAPGFVEETAASGIAQTYDGDAVYSVGGGVAVLDCNGDGKPDLYMAGGKNPAALYRNDSAVGGALKFTGLPDPVTDLTDVMGAYPIDIDGDGNPDLFVIRVGGSEILKGQGNCQFRDASSDYRFVSSAYDSAFAATWEGTNTLPTLAVGRYLKLDSAGKLTLDCDTSALYRPDPSSTSTYGAPLDLSPGYCTLSMLFSDWDRSGRRDLRMTNDRNFYTSGTDQLWKMNPEAPPTLYTDADGWVYLQIFGMGIASYDLSGTGYPDYYISSQGDNRLQTLTAGAGQPTYRDIALKRGVLAAQPFTGGDVLASTAWHPEFEDVNNDGFIDLFLSKGNIDAQPGFATKDPNNLFLGQPSGSFEEAADKAGILNYERGRGAALADFNLDGMLDLVEENYGAPARIWRNVGSGSADKPAAMGNWLAIRPIESGANRDAIGSWLEVKVGDVTMRRELAVGGGHESGQLGWVHFGLGPVTEAQVRVTWPDGSTGPWMSVSANQFLDVERGSAQPSAWLPPS